MAKIGGQLLQPEAQVGKGMMTVIVILVTLEIDSRRLFNIL
ncbi:hypothetical protein [Clostridium sp. Marseille-Q7071]